jgi:hypothetical protein
MHAACIPTLTRKFRGFVVVSWGVPGQGSSGTDGQCVGEMIFCVHEPQYAA